MEEGSVEFVLQRSFDLQLKLAEAERRSEKIEYLYDYIQECHQVRLPAVPEFKQEWEWFNTSRRLTAQEDLSGRIVVLDFFTYCCINCIHILPDLHRLEQKYPPEEGVLVIGVHSAKFENEKVSSNILNAILRYDITHACVNDSEASLWQQLQISCWPTLVILGPQNQILLMLVGEGHSQTLMDFVNLAHEFYQERQELKRTNQIDFLSLERLRRTPTQLYYPGKLCWDETGTRLAISDTGQHRVLITDAHGNVEHIIGGSSSGSSDGSFSEACFFNPQGVAWRGSDIIYVADTDNHTVRQIDLISKLVSTVVGMKEQGKDLEGGKKGKEQEISSPWDLAVVSSNDGDKDALLIAMAGTHQIWLYCIKHLKWIKNSSHEAETCIRFAGTGKEENRNNSYPHRASFAQPSGISLGQLNDVPHVFIADAESSSIRSVSLKDGAVKNVVGADRDPTNLFAYGDNDGSGFDVRLQHPLAVTVLNHDNILIADSYNHKIKKVSLSKRKCVTLYPSNQTDKQQDGVNSLNEPAGICMSASNPNLLYIADTNNHAVKVLDLRDNTLKKFEVIFSSERTEDLTDLSNNIEDEDPNHNHTISSPSILLKNHHKILMPEVSVQPGGEVLLTLNVLLSDGLHLTDDAPSKWHICSSDFVGERLLSHLTSRKERFTLDAQPTLKLQMPSNTFILDEDSRHQLDTRTDIHVECVLYYCGDDGACRMKGVDFIQPIVVSYESVDKYVLLQLHHTFS